jgi:hypothetical protein
MNAVGRDKVIEWLTRLPTTLVLVLIDGKMRGISEVDASEEEGELQLLECVAAIIENLSAILEGGQCWSLWRQ